jgi:Lon protease-like protein
MGGRCGGLRRSVAGMSTLLPLFPLGTVLYPGLVLPLHIFEDRYRQLVAELVEQPEPREFGVIAIRHGRETGVDGVSDLYEVGCTAALRQVERFEDGRYALVTVGSRRFRLLGLTGSAPYLQGDVDMLAEEAGDMAAAALAVPKVQQAFQIYLTALAERRGAPFEVPELPAEPVLLSYLVAATIVVDLADKQRLLAAPDGASRLAVGRELLTRETRMLRSLTAAPAPDLRYSPYSPN